MTGKWGSLRERLYRHIALAATTEGCWIWSGSRNNDGYGMMWDRETRCYVKAHRASWRVHNGPIPPGLNVLHSCDTPACVNPSHLHLGTQRENMAEASGRGRLANRSRGERHYRARLTEQAVVEMRRERASGTTVEEIARRHHVAPVTVWRVVNRLSWAHVA